MDAALEGWDGHDISTEDKEKSNRASVGLFQEHQRKELALEGQRVRIFLQRCAAVKPSVQVSRMAEYMSRVLIFSSYLVGWNEVAQSKGLPCSLAG